MEKITIDGVEISKDKLKELAIEHGLMKVEKPFNALYVSENGQALVWFTGDSSGFGFSHGVWWEKNDDYMPLINDWWQPATPQDHDIWKELLIEKARSMGYKHGNYECLLLGGSSAKNPEFFFGEYGSVYRGVNSGHCEYDKVFDINTGEWAKIIKTSVQERYEKQSYYQRTVILSTALTLMSHDNTKSELECIAEVMMIDNYDRNEEFNAY